MDAIFIVRRMQKEYLKKEKKLYACVLLKSKLTRHLIRLTISPVLAGTSQFLRLCPGQLIKSPVFFCIQSASIARPTMRLNLNLRPDKQKILKTKSSPMMI